MFYIYYGVVKLNYGMFIVSTLPTFESVTLETNTLNRNSTFGSKSTKASKYEMISIRDWVMFKPLKPTPTSS